MLPLVFTGAPMTVQSPMSFAMRPVGWEYLYVPRAVIPRYLVLMVNDSSGNLLKSILGDRQQSVDENGTRFTAPVFIAVLSCVERCETIPLASAL